MLTVYGIETSGETFSGKKQYAVATVLTVYGIETLTSFIDSKL